MNSRTTKPAAGGAPVRAALKSLHRRTSSASPRTKAAADRIEVIGHSVVYENPLPTRRSRHAFFPGIEKLRSGELLACFSMGEAFESNDQQVYTARSSDGGDTWTPAQPLNPQSKRGLGAMKPTLLNDGSLICLGYSFYRDDPEVLTNPQTGGLPPGDNLVSFSRDDGKTWTIPARMKLSRPELLEISGPCIQSRNGNLLALGTPMVQWDGTRPSGAVGLLLRSTDRGQTWNDQTIYLQHPSFTPLEARLCQMADGRIVALAWALDEKSGNSLNNHIAISHDDGQTWSKPIDIGIAAQASNLIPLEGDRLLSIHAHRESEPTGLIVRIVDLAGDRWHTLHETMIWSGSGPRKVTGFSDMGAMIKFGQPSLLSLGRGEYLAYNWSIESGQGRILAHRLRVKG